MAANTTPIFILSANVGTARLTGSNTTSDASSTTNLQTLVTAGADGTRIDAVRFRNSQASAASSSAMVHRVFHYTGSVYRLIGEVATAAATRSTSAVGATSIITFDLPIFIPSGHSLVVGQSVYAGAQDQFDAIAYAGNY
jgi:hypothetical protein